MTRFLFFLRYLIEFSEPINLKSLDVSEMKSTKKATNNITYKINSNVAEIIKCDRRY